MATLFRVVIALAILIAAGRVVAQEDFRERDEAERYWVEKIELEQERAAKSARDVARLEGEISRAKRRQKPRGEVLREKIEALEAAKESGAEARALLPKLFDGARRAGVAPGALRHLE